MSIFRRKEIEQEKTEMKRHLGLIDLVFLGLGSIIGTGIFTITGIGAAKYAGPALVISIILAAIAVGISALIFAEFASRVPSSGGAYSYLYTTLGEFPAWMTGWYTILVFLMAISSVASGWSSYLKGLLLNYGISLPKALNGTLNVSNGTYVDLLPVLVLVFVTSIVLLNSKYALKFNSSLVVLKFSALILFLVIGVFKINSDNWVPFAPYGFGNALGGQNGIMAGASLMLFAFLGYEAIPTAIEETKNPQKNIPRGIVLSLATATIFYVAITLVLTGLVPYTELNVPDAVAFALRQVGATWAANYISIVAILTLITVCISMTYALARTIYSISRDGLLPKSLGTVSTKTKVPKNATLFTGFFAMIFAGLVPLETIAEFVNISTFSYLILLAIGLLKLRQDFGLPGEQEFRVPLVPILPLLSIFICIIMIIQNKPFTWLIFGIATVIGIIIYFAYGKKNSALEK